MKLMVVDDEPLIVKGLINVIRKGQVPFTEIVSASDGIDALEKLADYRPDIIITDIQMPEMNGFEFIKEVQTRGVCHRFVVLTGYDDTAYLRQAIRCRVIDYLLKPIDKIELYMVLAEMAEEIAGEEHSAVLPMPEQSTVNDWAGNPPVSKNMEKIIEFIEMHYTRDLSLDQIADHVHLHPNYISALFKKETSLTFIHFLHSKRIQKAKELIAQNPDMSLHNISEKVGFENIRHFFNVFKKYSGITPGKFRDANEES